MKKAKKGSTPKNQSKPQLVVKSTLNGRSTPNRFGTIEWLQNCRMEIKAIKTHNIVDRAKWQIQLFDPRNPKFCVQSMDILVWFAQGSGRKSYHTMLVKDRQYEREVDLLHYIDEIRDQFGENTVEKLFDLVEIPSGSTTHSHGQELLQLNKPEFKLFLALSYHFKVLKPQHTGWNFVSSERKRQLAEELTCWKREWACPDCREHYTLEQHMELREQEPVDLATRSLTQQQDYPTPIGSKQQRDYTDSYDPVMDPTQYLKNKQQWERENKELLDDHKIKKKKKLTTKKGKKVR